MGEVKVATCHNRRNQREGYFGYVQECAHKDADLLLGEGEK